MMGLMPARSQVSMAGRASGRGGSLIPTSPRNVIPRSASSRLARGFERHREHPQRLARHLAGVVEHALPVAGLERPLAVAREQTAAAPEDDLRRPLRVGDDSVGRAVQGRHPLGLGRERDLGQPREAGVEIVLVQAGLRRRHDERALRRVALGEPPGLCRRLVGAAFVSLSRASEASAAAWRSAITGWRRRDGGAGFEELPAGLVTGSGDVQRLPAGVDPPDGHLARGERAGLVGSDDRHASERLDGRQPADQDLRFTMRCTPSASEMVTTAGRASGTTATASAMPKITISEELSAHQAEDHDQRDDGQGGEGQHTAHPVEVLLQRRPAALHALSIRAISPNSVSMPVATTTADPRP